MGAVIFGLIGLIISLSILALIIMGVYILFKKIFGDSLAAKGDKGSKNFLDQAKDSLILRIILAGVLILISLIPLGFVDQLVDERGRLYENVASRMTSEWGGHQKISGPILSVPYEYKATVVDKITNPKTGDIKHVEREVTKEKELILLPEDLKIETNLETTELSRGIYTVPIYDSTHNIDGNFKWPDTSILDDKPEKFLWERAMLSFMITSTRGITGGTQLKWDGMPVHLSSGTGLNDLEIKGVHARLKLDPSFQTKGADFNFALNLRGSKGLDYAPTGRQSEIVLNANWPHPSFEGSLLPTTRNIEEMAFDASWNVTHLSRSYSQMAAFDHIEKASFFRSVYNFGFGVNLFQSVDLYTVLDRTIKYGIMFVALTFFSVFIMEFASGARLHWLQHLIIGASLSMFYLCVLALSEHIDFGYAYMSGVGVIAAMLGIYTGFVMGKILYGIGISGVMVGLYAVLYSILQMEDYALLIGTFLLLIFLGLGMFITRKLHKEV